MIVCCEKYIITTIIIIINYNDLNKILMYSYTLKVNACRNTKYKYNDKNDTFMYLCTIVSIIRTFCICELWWVSTKILINNPKIANDIYGRKIIINQHLELPTKNDSNNNFHSLSNWQK